MTFSSVRADDLPAADQRRILVVRALQLGDLLCAVPALRALREWQPAAHITLCGLPWAEQFVQRYSHLLDSFELFPGYHGIPERPLDDRAWAEWRERCHARPFDLIIQLHGSGPFINDFVRQTPSARTAGFHPSGQPELALDSSLPWPEWGHEIERLKSLLLHLGACDQGDHLELPLSGAEQRAAQSLLRVAGVNPGEPYICLHMGGRSLSRRWPVDKYADVARWLKQKGWVIVLTGVAEEVVLASQLQHQLRHACIDLTGRTNFGQLVGLIDGAELLLSNDTSLSHIAAARRTPSVVIVLGSDPERWLPLDRQLHRPQMVDVACRPCGPESCTIGFTCAVGVTAPMVIQAVGGQLRQNHRQRLSPTSTAECIANRL